jgi:hypothetical protein
VERLCDSLYGTRDRLRDREFEVVRVDAGWEAKQEPVFGGDPASAKRARDEAAPDRVSLPMAGAARPLAPVPGPELLGERSLLVRARDLSAARVVVADYAPRVVRLELDDYTGLDRGTLEGVPIESVVVDNVAAAESLLALEAGFEVIVLLDATTAAWLRDLPAPSPRLVIRQPTYERLTEAADRDVDLRAFFAALDAPIPAEGVPRCITENARPSADTMDTAMMTPEGQLEIFRFTKRFILEHYRVKSLRCATCTHEPECRGMHVNYVRAHGFDLMQPVE